MAMDIRERLREPAGIVVACVVGGVAGTLTAARGPSPWLALPIGVGVAAIVLVVIAAVGAATDGMAHGNRRPAPPEPADPAAKASKLLREAGDAAGVIRVRVAMALTDPKADQIVTLANSIVDAIYRHACLVTRASHGARRAVAIDINLNAMSVGTRSLQDVAQEVSTADPRLDQLTEDLTAAHTYLKRTAAQPEET